MWFEAKHCYFKHQAKIKKKFKNISLSLSKRYHADYLKFGHVDEGPTFREEEVLDDDKEILVVNVEKFTRLHDATQVYSLESVQIHGILYKPDKDAFVNLVKMACQSLAG